MNPTDGGPNPSDFELGSPESRAAARLLADRRQPITTQVWLDFDGNPNWEPSAIYGSDACGADQPLPREEWQRRYVYLSLTRGSPEFEAGERITAAEGTVRHENRKAWIEPFKRLAEEYGGRVPGSVAAARIPKGRPPRQSTREESRVSNADSDGAPR